jgi:hypothetical protein
MTGYFVRVMRDGKPRTLEIDELSDDELTASPPPTTPIEAGPGPRRW